MAIVEINPQINIDGNTTKNLKNWFKKYLFLLLFLLSLCVVGIVLFYWRQSDKKLNNEKLNNQELTSQNLLQQAENNTLKLQLTLLKDQVDEIKRMVANSASDAQSKEKLLDAINQKDKLINSILLKHDKEMTQARVEYNRMLKDKDHSLKELQEANDDFRKRLGVVQSSFDSIVVAFQQERKSFVDSIMKLKFLINDTSGGKAPVVY